MNKSSAFEMHLNNIRAARKEGNLQKELYYLQHVEKKSCPPYEEFKNSKNYDNWLKSKRNQQILAEMAEDRRSS